MILSILLSVFWPNPSLTAKFIFMAMTVLGALILGFRIFRSQRVQLIVGALAGLICVFMLGLAIAQSYVAGSKVLHQLLVGSESLNGRIIRSGERGIYCLSKMSISASYYKMGRAEEGCFPTELIASKLSFTTL
jgi:hypothetical protein